MKILKTYQLVLSLLSSLTIGLPALAGPVLKGNVQEQGKGQAAPGLTRHDIGGPPGTDDPFSNPSDNGQLAEPNFDVATRLPPAPPPRSFPLNVQQEGQDQFDPRMGQGVPDQVMQQPPPQQPYQSNAFTPNNDPDQSPEMQLLWDMWHKRVATTLYQRYTTLANAAFSTTRRPLYCKASYVVTRDGRVLNVQLVERSWNPIYNTLVLGVLNSIAGDNSLLSFPPNSRRNMVEKTATFTQGYGPEGYRHTTNDRETIRPGR